MILVSRILEHFRSRRTVTRRLRTYAGPQPRWTVTPWEPLAGSWTSVDWAELAQGDDHEPCVPEKSTRLP